MSHDPTPHEYLVAAIIQTAIHDICIYAANNKREAVWVRRALGNDEGVAQWAQCIGIAWPPELRVLQDIIAALDAGEPVWVDRYRQS